MKSKIIIVFLFISFAISAQQIIVVNSKTDSRLKSYQDSLKWYIYGQTEINVAKQILNEKDTMLGRISRNYLKEALKKLGLKAEDTCKFRATVVLRHVKIWFSVQDFVFSNAQQVTYWMPEYWEKPKVTVIYNPKQLPIIAIKTLPKKAKLSNKSKSTATSKKIIYNNVFTINGVAVSKNEFEKFSGKKIN